MKHFSYDPFIALGGKQNCTGGALRARAVDHDVSIRSTNAASVGQHAARAVDLSTPSAR
jgi:hypothetical protein